MLSMQVRLLIISKQVYYFKNNIFQKSIFRIIKKKCMRCEQYHDCKHDIKSLYVTLNIYSNKM